MEFEEFYYSPDLILQKIAMFGRQKTLSLELYNTISDLAQLDPTGDLTAWRAPKEKAQDLMDSIRSMERITAGMQESFMANRRRTIEQLEELRQKTENVF